MPSIEEILIVDDDEHNRYLLGQGLRKLGYSRIVEASNGREALCRIASRRPDLVLMDVTMPIMDGVSALEALREQGLLHGLPVIMISANDQAESVVRCIELGAEDYLTKPVNLTLLRARVEATLEKRRLRQVEADYLRHIDHETGLANRASLLQELARLRDAGAECAVVAIHIPHHPEIALGQGEATATRRLAQLAELARDYLRPGELLGRVAEDALAWLVPRFDAAYLLIQRAETLGRLLGGSESVVGQPSCGIAFASAGFDTGENMLRTALRSAQNGWKHGGSRVTIADTALQDQIRESLSLYTEVGSAYDDGQFRFHYQPLVCARTGAVRGCEALLRWLHPSRGLVSPDQFLPLIENSPLMLDVGQWALSTACEQLALWADRLTPEFNLAVNLTGHEILAGETVSLLRDRLAPAYAHHLKVELTERVLIEDLDNCNTVLAALRALGVRVALDDFGTGYSALNHLNRIPCDTLKIDRSFVEHIDERRHTRSIVRAMVEMAHSLDIEVVAEGVEREAEFAVVREIGCDLIQGYLFAPALEEAIFLRHLSAGFELPDVAIG